MKPIVHLPIFLIFLTSSSAKEIFKDLADLNLAVLTHDCGNRTDQEFLVDSAIWTVQKLNHLQFLPVKIGLAVYETCTEKQEFQSAFDLFLRKENEYFFGVISDEFVDIKLRRFTAALNLEIRETAKFFGNLISASVALLETIGMVENVTILAPSQSIAEQFVKSARKQDICVNEVTVYESTVPLNNSTRESLIIFGTQTQLTAIIQDSNISGAVLVLLDGSTLKVSDVPDSTYIITTPQTRELNYTPNPRLFDIATPIVLYALHLQRILANSCNDTVFKINCLKNEKFTNFLVSRLDLTQMLDLLKLDFLVPTFNYLVYKSDNLSQTLLTLYSYNVFYDNLTLLEPNYFEITNSTSSIERKSCKMFETSLPFRIGYYNLVEIRAASWVFAFLSISLLGVLFCVAILIFLLVAVCRRNVLEGNPTLTILLLVAVMLMYCSILPLSLEGTKQVEDVICIARALSITLSFAAAFSLILSRSILLATAAKEIGFMSHVAGPVQSFLCLFIFGVQAALSLHTVRHCDEVFKSHFFIYLLAYNAMLLLLLLCLCPLMYKSQRNYREGKYFALAVMSTSFLWCIWIPAYALLPSNYKDPVLCFGLVSTASVLIGTIFVPRTYIMTIAAARDKLTSTLPSIPSTSAMDLYRSASQPVYDCVNIAAINAVTVARAGLNEVQEPDLYTCPNLEDFVDCCDSPISNDKVTRF